MNGLPVELLVEIFKQSVIHNRLRGDRLSYQELHCLALVCKRWADIVQGNPKLWVAVEGHRLEHEWRTALALSGSHPINVTCINVTNEHFWHAITPQLHRWNSAHIFMTQGWALSALELNDAPRLERLHLRTQQEFNSVVMDLFNGYAPNLRYINLSEVVLRNWNSAILIGLKALTLDYISHSGPSAQQIVNVLRACPELEILRVHDVACSKDLPYLNK